LYSAEGGADGKLHQQHFRHSFDYRELPDEHQLQQQQPAKFIIFPHKTARRES